jgi:pSer/pThr/pTyr-binding forkhead associated (FHA) protein
MPHGLLEILRYFLLALLWLFFLYAARMVLVEVRRSRAERPTLPEVVVVPPQADTAPRLHLRVVDPPQRRGRIYDLGDEITLGRSSGCAVALEDDTFASTVHARVFQRNGELWLEDLGSTNGTYLNEARLGTPARLQRGDRVKVGTTILEVAR